MRFQLIEGVTPWKLSMIHRKRNPEIAYRVYLLEDTSDISESPYMIVLIDLLGCSDDKTMCGSIVRVLRNTANETNSSTTSLSAKESTFSREEFNVTYIGSLTDSIYLLNPSLIPSYVLQYIVNLSPFSYQIFV